MRSYGNQCEIERTFIPGASAGQSTGPTPTASSSSCSAGCESGRSRHASKDSTIAAVFGWYAYSSRSGTYLFERGDERDER
eukprot:31528-Pelagococcus_subviridis.AAC.5